MVRSKSGRIQKKCLGFAKYLASRPHLPDFSPNFVPATNQIQPQRSPTLLYPRDEKALAERNREAEVIICLYPNVS